MLKEKVLTFNQQVYYNKQYEHDYKRVALRKLFGRNAQCSGERRTKILAYLKQFGELHVNRKHCVIIKHDKDLQLLLKTGKIKLHKWRIWRNSGRQFITLN